MQWYYSKNATQLGPVDQDELRSKLASGEVSGTDMVWREGMPDWRPACTMPELAVPVAVPPSVGMASSPYAPPGVSTETYVPARTSGLAITSLVCGILGLFCGFVSGIPAVICGHIALKQIADSKVRLEGRGMAIAGLVLGYFSIAIILLWLFAIVVGISTTSFR